MNIPLGSNLNTCIKTQITTEYTQSKLDLVGQSENRIYPKGNINSSPETNVRYMSFSP